MIPFSNLPLQYHSIKQEIDDAISSVIEHAAFISGEPAKQFENEFAAYLGIEHCIGCANGTDAIEIAIEALGLPKGSEIIVPANSFIASSEAVTRSGCKIVFADCDERTLSISPEDIRKKITEKTSAILPVHLYGQPCDMDEILSIAKEHNLRIIEDCAQAHGASYKGKTVGTLGDAATFSFYPGKNLGAYGDAGCIVTNNGAAAQRARKIANHGRLSKYDHELEGRNSRLDGMQAAILSVKLRHLNTWTSARQAVAGYYRTALHGVGDIRLQELIPDTTHVYHLFTIRTSRRDELQAHLSQKEIQTIIHYPIALPKLKAYHYLDAGETTPIAVQTADTILSLPIGEHISQEDAAFVCESIRDFFS